MSEQKHTPEVSREIADKAYYVFMEALDENRPLRATMFEALVEALRVPAAEIERLRADRAALVEALKNLPGLTIMSNSHDSWPADRGPGEGGYVYRRDMEEAIAQHGGRRAEEEGHVSES